MTNRFTLFVKRPGMLCVMLSAGIGATCLCAASAQAAYPDRPIRWILPIATGGGVDTLARTIQGGFTDSLGAVVLDNRPGGSSVIGTEIVAKAAPDGYTLLFITTTHTVNPSMIPKLPYDSIRDFSAVSLLVSQPNILVVPAAVPVKTMKELIALAKAKPISFASGGNGSQPHLTGELFKSLLGLQITHVPYKSAGPAVIDLLGGHVQMMFVGPLAVDPHIRSGRVRALAVASTKRLSIHPDVPTTSEAGVNGLESGTWYGMLAPARTPQSIIDRVHAALVKTMKMPDVNARLLAQGVDVIGMPPQEFSGYVKSEVAKWEKVIKDAKIKPE
jgi:tripartite-type tricarboxylate transporter receptor subunit TctC